MKVSFAKQIINPDLPCHMEGYNDRISHSIHDNIELRTFMITNEETVVIHVLDILLISPEFSQRLKETLAKQFGLRENNIIIQATHTHSGPKVSTYLFPDILPSHEYMELLEQKMIENTEQCLGELIEGAAYFGQTTVNGLYSNRNGVNLPYNNQMLSIQFRDRSGEPLFQIVNLACHPTILPPDFKEISSDLFGTFRDEFERKMSIPLIIMNGEAGDVSTRFTRKSQNYTEVERIGTKLAELLNEIENYSPISFDKLKVTVCEHEYTYYPKQDEYLIKIRKQLSQLLDETGFVGPENAVADLLRTIDSKLSKETIHYQYTSTIIESEEFRMITFPGELVTALGQKIREKSDKKTFIVAYADDFKGYAVNVEAFGKIPETNTSEFPVGVSDIFINKIIETFKK